MKKHFLLLVIVAVAASACKFNKSVSSNPSVGLSTKGNGLSSDDIKLVSEGEQLNDNTFTFGQDISIIFEDMQGFQRRNGEASVGMQLLVLAKNGDTVLYNPDLYADYNKPINQKVLQLSAGITTGRPMRSKEAYTAFIHIWDKKGKGTFDATLKFKLKANEYIRTETSGISYNEVYLYNEETEKVITDNRIPENEQIRIIFLGLKGFNSEEDSCALGCSMVATSNSGRELFQADDVTEGIRLHSATVNELIMPPYFAFSGRGMKVLFETEIWDKNGNGRIKATVPLIVH